MIQLSLYSHFNVVRAQDLFEMAGCEGLYNPMRSLPDHNLLEWKLHLEQFIGASDNHDSAIHTPPIATVRKYELSNIPREFMLDEGCINAVRDTIRKLENAQATKQEISDVYKDFCETVTTEMNENVLYKDVVNRNDCGKRRRHVKKPYWNVHLDSLYKQFRKLDKRWASAKGVSKRRLQVERSAKRKELDREIQKAKRKHWQYMQQTILELEAENQREFWKYIGKVGIANERKSAIPWEIVNSDGSTSRDCDEVLESWR